MDIHKLYKNTRKKLQEFENNLENYGDICNPNKSQIFDTIKQKKYDNSYSMVYNSIQQGGLSLYREVLSFWSTDKDELKELTYKLGLKFRNEWDLKTVKPLPTLKPTANLYALEHDREYIHQLMMFTRAVNNIGIENESLEQFKLL